MAILSIDAGTTGVTALLVSESGEVLAKGYREFPQYFPEAGWVEHDAEEIFQATLGAMRTVLAQAKERPTALGITNQRETVVVWEKASGKPARKAIVWQDRRTASIIYELHVSGLEYGIRAKTGLGLDPYFSSSKLLWLSRNEPALWLEVQEGKLLLGTVDSYLIYRLTGGSSHITDASNASRTQLMNIDSVQWDEELLEVFNTPISSLPEIVPSYGELATTDPAFALGLEIPIAGIAGDQQAALFGQAAFSVGENKCTYGTGAFILSNTGENRVASTSGLLSTIAWMSPDGKITYALEGSVFVAGAAVQWLRDGLQIISAANEIEELAESVDSTNGVVFVPALTGIGAPYWDSQARGTILGITRGTIKAHIARATLEAIAYSVRDVVDAIVKDSKTPLTALHVDGGAAANNLLMQLQADCLGIDVVRGKNLESTALGAAFLAGLGSGLWSSAEELRGVFKLDRKFRPRDFDERNYLNWQQAVAHARSWSPMSTS